MKELWCQCQKCLDHFTLYGEKIYGKWDFVPTLALLNRTQPYHKCGGEFTIISVSNRSSTEEISMEYATDLETLKKETEVFPFGASTKGGQRANRKKTGIELYHKPSRIRIRIIKERSQDQNRKIAFDRLRERLERLNRPKKRRIPTRIPRSVKEGRLRRKKVHSQKKQLRRKPISE